MFCPRLVPILVERVLNLFILHKQTFYIWRYNMIDCLVFCAVTCTVYLKYSCVDWNPSWESSSRRLVYLQDTCTVTWLMNGQLFVCIPKYWLAQIKTIWFFSKMAWKMILSVVPFPCPIQFLCLQFF